MVVVGYVRRAHGVNGAVILRPMSDDPLRFGAGNEFWTDDPSVPHLKLVATQPHKDGLLARLEGVTDRNAAEMLRGVTLLIDAAERRNLEDDEYWPEDLVGLDVSDPAGLEIGVVVAVIEGMSQDRLRVATPHEIEFDVPFVADLVTEVDLAGRRLTVDIPDGLAELGTTDEPKGRG